MDKVMSLTPMKDVKCGRRDDQLAFMKHIVDIAKARSRKLQLSFFSFRWYAIRNRPTRVVLITGNIAAAIRILVFCIRRQTFFFCVKWHSKLWGFSGARRQYEIGFRAFGALAMIFGVLVLTGTIRLH
jgi:hypothetical protein